MRAFATIRLLVAAVFTLAMLPYAWGRVLVYPMAVGELEPMWIGLLAASIASLFVITWRLRPALDGLRWPRWVLFGLSIGWIAALSIVVLLTAVPTVSPLALVGLFVPATLWAPWAGWIGYSGRPAKWKYVALGGFIAAIVPFPALVRVERLAGDNKAYFAWRDAPRQDYTGPAKEPMAAAPVSIGPGGADDSPQFLGPTRNGNYPHIKLADWTTAPPREMWHRPIGVGWSSFAIVDGYCFTQEQRGDEECVTCYRLADGAPVWKHAEPGRFNSSMGGDGPRATPTVAAGGHVYAVGSLGVLVCLDGASGKKKWSVDIVKESGGTNLMHGVSGSPLVDGERVIVCPPGPDGPSLAAYHTETGSRLWATGSFRASYSSPTLWELDGQKQILLFDHDGLSGFDAAAGQPLWHFHWANPENVHCSQPIGDAAGPGTILVTTGYGLGSALVRVWREGPDRWLCDHIWKRNVLKTRFTTAVLYQGHAYGLDESVLTCVDAATGKTRWKDGKYEHGQVILAGDRLIVQAESGEVALVEASPAGFKELGRVRGLLGEDGSKQMTWNVPVLSGKFLVIRNDREAVCYQLTPR